MDVNPPLTICSCHCYLLYPALAHLAWFQSISCTLSVKVLSIC
ncbi:hypothetical protein M5D96_005170 [Drosophila gunungcola]|uniref:Uncharacterized protein n=1 Tax=Drosophila gunungcola TaxID=103775 RepID=A0A9Q0BT68_9MUSC|nr:hypothetical protein M5D96_005170 [Drosophila gunungcola]